MSLRRSGKWREKGVVEEKWKVEGEGVSLREKWKSGGRRVSLRRSGKWREKGVVEEKWKVEGEGCR